MQNLGAPKHLKRLFPVLYITSLAFGHECRLWLAPSYLSGKTKRFGVFAGVAFDENETIPHSEIAIPLVDAFSYLKDHSELNVKVMEYLESLVWAPEYAGAQWEGKESSPIIIPGLGLLVNYHTGMVNIAWDQSASLLRDRESITTPGQPHPSRGAISNFYNMTLKATRRIRKGMELFADFGDLWDPEKEDIYQDTITRRDYDDADAVVKQLVEFLDEYQDQVDDKLIEDLIDFILDKVLFLAAEKRAKTIRSLIPAQYRKLKEIVELGGTFEYRYADMARSDVWLEKHGLCLDYMHAGQSGIPGAGRGAFASKDFKKGEVIAPIPLIPVANRTLLDMDPAMMGVKDYTGPTRQLLENYCLGHPESSMLLLMAGPLNTLINHGTIGRQGNAYLLWSVHDHIINDHALHDRTVRDVVNAPQQPIITMTLHAFKDIKAGEEILIDYEQEWVNAWDSYMQRWNESIKVGGWPLKAEDVKLLSREQAFPLVADAYPPGVGTACFLEVEDPEDGTPRRTNRNVKIMRWAGPKRIEDFVGEKLVGCTLLQRFRKDDNYIYNVEATLPGSPEAIQINAVPHKAITLVDLPYTSDTFAPGAFRHYIGMRDQSFPMMWRDLR